MTQLSEEAARLYTANDNDALFHLAEASWRPGDGELVPGAGEVARYAAIRARETNAPEQHLWRARGLTAAVIFGARDTAAGLLLHPFFALTSIAVEKSEGASHAHEVARAILEEMKKLVPEDSPAWSSLFGRLYHEKRAYSFLMEASATGLPGSADPGLLGNAEDEYRLALERAAGDPRGTLKVRGGLALVGYLRSATEPEPTTPIPTGTYLDETREIRRKAAEEGFDDVEKWAATNERVMERGQLTGWTPYEVV